MEYYPRHKKQQYTYYLRILVISLCLSVALASCARKSSQPEEITGKPDLSIESTADVESLSIFFTGNELGALKPCGCSGGQLGGIEKRPAVFNTVDESRRLIVDTGSLVAGDSEQDLIKFNILNRAYKLLNYDLVNLNENDIKTTRNLGLLNNPTVKFVSFYANEGEPVLKKYTRRYLFKGKPLDITIVPFSPESARIENIEHLFLENSENPTINILVLNQCDRETVDLIKSSVPSADCIICPPEADEPDRISPPSANPLTFSVGRYGKYVCQVLITGSAEDKKSLDLSFKAIKVTEDLKPDPSLVELYKAYQQILKTSNLLEEHPRLPLGNGLEYAGSESCKLCHKEIYEKWSQFGHADAYKTLVDVGSEADPECIGCHVIGFDYETGFVNMEKTPKMINVGCENCHGPGSKHISSAGEVRTADPKMVCEDCHTPEHSSNFAANQEKYYLKIKHWEEPKTASSVK